MDSITGAKSGEHYHTLIAMDVKRKGCRIGIADAGMVSLVMLRQSMS
jgi:hypothetical protein